MFSNFKKAFKDDESNTKVPDAVIEALSDHLPDGFTYTQIYNEVIGVVPTTGQLNMKVNISYPLDFKPASTQELAEYLYRSQQELEVPTNSVEINGHKFTHEELISFPFSENMMSKEGKLVIKPAPFPDPFPVYIEYKEKENIKKYFQMKRQPYPDMEKSMFKSIDSGPLTLSYIMDEKNNDLNLTVNVNIDQANKPLEVVEAFKIYHGFIQGKIKFNGADLNAVPNKSEDSESIKEIINFWEKVDLIGSKIDKNFKPKENISLNDVIWIEKLYKSFIEDQPYKEYFKINKLTTEIIDIDKTEVINNEGFALQFSNFEEIKLFDVNLSLFNLVALFNLKVIDIIEKNEKYEFIIEPITNKGVYRSIQHFINEKEANKYKASEILQKFQNADTITDNII